MLSDDPVGLRPLRRTGGLDPDPVRLAGDLLVRSARFFRMTRGGLVQLATGIVLQCIDNEGHFAHARKECPERLHKHLRSARQIRQRSRSPRAMRAASAPVRIAPVNPPEPPKDDAVPQARRRRARRARKPRPQAPLRRQRREAVNRAIRRIEKIAHRTRVEEQSLAHRAGKAGIAL